jgi:hypothetical protein
LAPVAQLRNDAPQHKQCYAHKPYRWPFKDFRTGSNLLIPMCCTVFVDRY